MHLKHATLTFLLDQNNAKPRVLLGMKKRGFGTGKWNGYGGKILDGESAESAAVREIKEESGLEIRPHDLQKIGELTFLMPYHPHGTQIVHVYLAQKWKGKPVETDEMKPEWFLVDQLPFEQMWPDDKHWLRGALDGKPVTATFLFNQDNETLKAMEIHHPKTAKELQLPAVYFSASIAGGRDLAHLYPPIVQCIKKHGRVLTEHFASPTMLTERETGKTDEFLYWRDHAWIEACDWLIADVSQPSLGVGYEIALAEKLNKKILCLYYKKAFRELTAMVRGNHRVHIIEYENENEAVAKLDKVLKEWKGEIEPKRG